MATKKNILLSIIIGVLVYVIYQVIVYFISDQLKLFSGIIPAIIIGYCYYYYSTHKNQEDRNQNFLPKLGPAQSWQLGFGSTLTNIYSKVALGISILLLLGAIIIAFSSLKAAGLLLLVAIVSFLFFLGFKALSKKYKDKNYWKQNKSSS